MTRRLAPAPLVALVLAAHSAGADTLALWALLAAIAATAFAGLDAFGRLVELPGSARGIGLLRAEVTAAASALALACVAGAFPALAAAAVVACLALVVVQASLALGAG